MWRRPPENTWPVPQLGAQAAVHLDWAQGHVRHERQAAPCAPCAMCWRLKHYVMEAATLCDGGCKTL